MKGRVESAEEPAEQRVHDPGEPILRRMVIAEETLYVLDVDAAFGAASKVRKQVYGSEIPQLASNLIGVSRLAFPQQLVEITFRAVVDR